MAWDCLVKGNELENVRADRRTLKSVEKYGISEQAVYFDGKYLPIALIRDVRVQPSVYRPQCCCGRGIPVFKIRLDYGAEQPLVLMTERKENAEKLVSQICAANPAVTVSESEDPATTGSVL